MILHPDVVRHARISMTRPHRGVNCCDLTIETYRDE